MEKKKGHEIKISPKDRIEALTRVPEFLEDLKQTIFHKETGTKVVSHSKQLAFSKKYNLYIPPSDSFNSLEECVQHMKEFFEVSGFEYDYGTKLVGVSDSKLIITKLSSKARKEIFPRKRSQDSATVYEYNKHPFIEDDRFITIKIDLSKTKRDILKEIEKTVRFFQGNIKKTKGRIRVIDHIWDVHDMHHKEGLKKYQIAKRFITGREIMNKNKKKVFNAQYESVRYAIKKAAKIIEQVKQSI